MRGGSRILSVAFLEGQIAGAVQLSLEPRANGNHRAEVMKLMVHRRSRGRGIGKALMSHVEEVARKNGRTLIVLDTRSGCGDVAEQLYYKLGYKKGGVIPRYARSACGTLHDTVFMYRKLEG
jgi:acetyltransferase